MPPPKNAFLIIGDPFLGDQQAKESIKQIKLDYQGTVQEISYRFSDITLDQVLVEARSLPFLTEAQIFHLREAESLKDKDIEVLQNYLDQPSETSYLIFQADASLDRRSKFVKLMEKKAKVFVIDDSKKKSESTRFIQEKLRTFGKKMTPGALARLNEQAGEMPLVLDSILNQLITYADKETMIDESIVAKFEEKWGEVDVFELVNAIGAKKTDQALLCLEALLEDYGDMISLLGLLHWQMKRFWYAKHLLSRGESEGNVLRSCKISPRQAPYFLKQLKLFSLSKLESAIEELFQIDWKTKTGRVDGNLAMEKWVVELTT